MLSITPGLAQYIRSGIEFIIDSGSGDVFLTQHGYSKLSGIKINEIVDRLEAMTEGVDWRETTIHCIGGDEKKDVLLIPAETVYDWLLVDRPGIAAKMAKETGTAATYFYRLATQQVNRIELAQSMLDALKQQQKDLDNLTKTVKENANKLKAQEAFNEKAQASFVQLEKRLAVDAPENCYTVPQYLEEVRRKKTPVSLSEVIQLNNAAINVCQNRKIEIRETVFNRLGTVYAFPYSVLQELEQKMYDERKG